MSKIISYLDESFHDRNLTLDEKGFNFLVDNQSEFYVAVTFYLDSNLNDSYEIKYKEFESLIRKQLELPENFEIKSSYVKKKYYKYGLQGFKPNHMILYDTFFKELLDKNFNFNITVINKIEMFLRRVLRFYDDKIEYRPFFYSLTKLISCYYKEDIIKLIYESEEHCSGRKLKTKIIKFVDEIISATKGHKVREFEYKAALDCKRDLICCPIDDDINMTQKFMYTDIFTSFKKKLEADGIDFNDVYIFIDNESVTLDECKRNGFIDSCNVDSNDKELIRNTDLMCGFLSRFFIQLENDASMNEGPLTCLDKIRYLSKRWFDLDKEKFQMYKNIKDILSHTSNFEQLVGNNDSLFALDVISKFYSLMDYIGSYEDFEQFNMIKSADHSIIYNDMCTKYIRRSYTIKQMPFGLL